jgi:predicted deacylase
MAPLILLVAIAATAAPASEPDNPPGRRHRVYFADTDRELNVYEITGRQEGPTLLIIGGIHGNEPGGYLAADLYADLTLKKGNLIVVPRANIYSIFQNERGLSGDLNRQFGTEHDHEMDATIVSVLTELMSEADALLNLHDGSGFYSPEWEGDLRNPLRWGQTVIIDTDVLTTRDGTKSDMEGLARRVVELANREILDPQHRFRLKNTRTFSEASAHKEQRGSATFFAVSQVGIPAFGIETSKEIPDEAKRVEYQMLIINEFLKELGIVPDHPRFALETPSLSYLAVSVDGRAPVVVEDGGSLAVPPGARVEITHVEANYERGLVVDIEGFGGFNDRGSSLVLNSDTRVVVRKDKYPCGEIWLKLDPDAGATTARPAPVTTSPRPDIEAFRLSVNGQAHFLEPGGTIQVVRGSELLLSDPMGWAADQYQVNFRGFVGNPVANDGEDRGYVVHTDHDLLQRFSLSPDEERYEIRAERGVEILATSYVEITNPRLDYVLLRLDAGPLLAVASGDTVDCSATRRLMIRELVTLPREAYRFTVNFRGFAGPVGAEDRGQIIDLRSGLLNRFSLTGSGRFYEITVDIGGAEIGRVVVDLGPGGERPN